MLFWIGLYLLIGLCLGFSVVLAIDSENDDGEDDDEALDELRKSLQGHDLIGNGGYVRALLVSAYVFFWLPFLILAFLKV